MSVCIVFVKFKFNKYIEVVGMDIVWLWNGYDNNILIGFISSLIFLFFICFM